MHRSLCGFFRPGRLARASLARCLWLYDLPWNHDEPDLLPQESFLGGVTALTFSLTVSRSSAKPPASSVWLGGVSVATAAAWLRGSLALDDHFVHEDACGSQQTLMDNANV